MDEHVRADGASGRKPAAIVAEPGHDAIVTALLDGIAEPLCVADDAGLIVLANRAAARAVGVQDAAALAGRPLAEIQPRDGWLPGRDDDGAPAGTAVATGGLGGLRLYRCAENGAPLDPRLLQQVLDSVLDRVSAGEDEARFLFAVAATGRFMGRELDESMGQRDVDFYPPEEVAPFIGADRRALAAGAPLVVEQPCRRERGREGTRRALEVPMREATERVVGLGADGPDVTELRRAKATLARQTRELHMAQRVAGLASWRWQAGTRYLVGSSNLTHLLGLDPAADRWPVVELLRRVCPRCRRRLLASVRTALARGHRRAVEVCLDGHDPDGKRMRCTFHREVSAAGVSIFGVVQNVTEQKRLERRLHDLAYRDGLTALANRSALHEALAHAVARYDRDGQPAALLLLNLDRFKVVNDTLGHAAGDRLLVLVADRLLAGSRGADLVARLGSDEFALVLGGVGHVDAARDVAERLVAALREPFVLNGTSVTIGASVGVALLPQDATEAEAWLRNADLALYQMKSEGRDGIRLFDRSLDRSRRLRLDLIAELREAIATESLDLHYQPQIDLQSGAIVGFEALARWRHPQRGMIPPSEFVALAEQSSLIGELGRYVLRRACAQWRRFAAAGRPEVAVSVNVSPAQLWHIDLVAETRAALAAHAMPAANLVLEVTENVFLDHHRGAVSGMLGELRALGVKLSLDDFGTGFSSLAYLSGLPFDHLKIDRCFVSEVDRDADRRLLLEGIVALGHALRLEVVAEGIETSAELAVLETLGCDLGQGYLFGRAVDPTTAEGLLATPTPCPATLASTPSSAAFPAGGHGGRGGHGGDERSSRLS